MNLSNHEKKFYIIQFEEKKKMYSHQIIQCIWLVRIAGFEWFVVGLFVCLFFYWNSECERQTFRIKLIQKYTQVYQLATKQQVTHIWTLLFPSDPSEKCKRKESLLGPNIQNFRYKDLESDEIQLLFHRLSSVSVSIQRWNFSREELILWFDSGRRCGPLCYQSPSLAWAEWYQKQSLCW